MSGAAPSAGDASGSPYSLREKRGTFTQLTPPMRPDACGRASGLSYPGSPAQASCPPPMSPAYPRTPASVQWDSPRSPPSGVMDPSPRLYDRTGQVGLGELATPRWMLSQGGNESLMTPPSAPLPRRTLLQDTSFADPHAASASSTAARHARAISYSIDHTAPAPLPSFTSMQFDTLAPHDTSLSHLSPPGQTPLSPGHRRQPSLGMASSPGTATLLPPPVMQVQPYDTSHADLVPRMQHLDVTDAYAPHGHSDEKSVDDVFTGQMPPMMPTMTLATAEEPFSSTLTERTAFSRVEKEAGQDHTRWSVMPTNPASPLSHPTSPGLGQAIGTASPSPASHTLPPPPVPDASPRVSKSPRWRRQSSSAQVEEGEESSSLAGRLSRRSLLALGSLFKVSPRRDKAKEDAKPENTDVETAATPSRASRISFSRRRRQSSQQLRTPRAPEQETVPVGASDMAAADVPPSSLPVSAPHGTSKPARRDVSETGSVSRAEPSPYYTAKAQGSRIPRASSMVRMLNRKAMDAEEKAPELSMPTSASMHSVPSISESPSQRTLATRHSLVPEPSAVPRRHAEDLGSPVKARSMRKSVASNEAMEALRRQRHLAATPKDQGTPRTKERKPSSLLSHGVGAAGSRIEHAMQSSSSQREQATEALRRSRDEATTAARAREVVHAELGARTPSVGTTVMQDTTGSSPSSTAPSASTVSASRPYAESGIPVPTDARRRSSSVQSRRMTRTPTLVDDTAAADEEMERHIQRVYRRKLASGSRPEDVDKLLSFPQPVAPSKRLSPRQAEVIYGNHLCPYEVQEMKEYENIYYVGSFARHKHYAVPSKPERNYGYDDERGDYIVNMRDHLAYRYEITKVLGRGSFGQVLQCRDHKTGKYVAIKLIRNKRRFHHQAVVEVKIMKHLTNADTHDRHHVVHMSDSFTFRHHLCVTMELLSINLYELIKANNFDGFSTTLIRRFAYQTLTCLSLMWQARIVHCDLKPENILLVHPRRSEIRVIDFGSSCFEDEKVYTYIQSRFYRSPEVILGVDYHMAIDMWSLGCILVELHTGYPIFPGENEQDQLACMMEVLGVPDRSLLERSTRRKLFFDSTGAPRPVVTSRGHKRRPNSKSLISAVRSNDELFLDFVARCLTWDPERRLQPEAALRHPWFQQRATELNSGVPRAPTTRRTPRSDAPRSDGSLLPRATPGNLSVRSHDVSTR